MVTLYEPAAHTGRSLGCGLWTSGLRGCPTAAGALVATGLTVQNIIVLTVVPAALGVAVALAVAMTAEPRHQRTGRSVLVVLRYVQ